MLSVTGLGTSNVIADAKKQHTVLSFVFTLGLDALAATLLDAAGAGGCECHACECEC